MPLTPGTRVRSYEVREAIGSGGMGEVYRAHDTALQRDVAIKILPEFFAADPERLARFAREAHILASLNHPNIAQVYGVEETAGIRALVMELVEGRMLQEVIPTLTISEVCAIARQIAAGLEAAHEQGIVHRDLKPSNVKVRVDGSVKIPANASDQPFAKPRTGIPILPVSSCCVRASSTSPRSQDAARTTAALRHWRARDRGERRPRTRVPRL